MKQNAPNILFVMADQLAPQALPIYGNNVVKAPNIEKIAQNGTVFDNAYCNSPMCGPSRSSMLTSQYASSLGTFDNASELLSSVPTFMHYLRNLNYETILSGKMHFIGPDQLHGFEERLTTDIYPADFGWTPDWEEGEFNKPTGISARGVVEAGTCYRNLQIDYDEEVEFKAKQKLYDLARGSRDNPFFMCVSFSNPHSPFQIMPEYWDRYNHNEIDLPTVPRIPFDKMDPYSQWLQLAHGMDRHTVTEEHVRNARHAYYGMISYIDDKVGNLMQTLKECDFSDNTIIIFVSDHGEMMGERGMWYKQTFFEWSSRVPLLIYDPTSQSNRSRANEVVSLIDLFPTILDLATEGEPPQLASPIEGSSLSKLMYEKDNSWGNTVFSEYLAEGVRGPCLMIRKNRYKYIYIDGNQGMLFDLESDPNELHNLSGQSKVKEIEQEMREELLNKLNPDEIRPNVKASQKRRLFINDAIASERQSGWEYQVPIDDKKRFLRNGASPMNMKSKMRWPSVKPVPEDIPEEY